MLHWDPRLPILAAAVALTVMAPGASQRVHRTVLRSGRSLPRPGAPAEAIGKKDKSITGERKKVTRRRTRVRSTHAQPRGRLPEGDSIERPLARPELHNQPCKMSAAITIRERTEPRLRHEVYRDLLHQQFDEDGAHRQSGLWRGDRDLHGIADWQSRGGRSIDFERGHFAMGRLLVRTCVRDLSVRVRTAGRLCCLALALVSCVSLDPRHARRR